jgi:transcription elongation GreA/GreB family factor
MLYLLYESPMGLALFKKKEYDEVAGDTTQVLSAIKDLAKFSKMCKL